VPNNGHHSLLRASFFVVIEQIRAVNVECRVADPLHFHADRDPNYQFNSDPDPALRQSEANLPPTGPQTLHASIVSAQGPRKMAPEFGLSTDPDRDPALNSKCESGSGIPKNWDPCGTD
jgi:hypothetical protein